jgi:hypothetical protein
MLGGRRTYVFLSIVGLGAIGCSGAREVRYVYQDSHSGVIGMPANTSQWPTYYRKHADKMMEKHFPEGYDVVRAEEVVEGSRTLTINGSNAAEIQPAASSHLLAIGKLGRTTSRTQADSLKIKECRILYKKSEQVDPQKQLDYAEQAMWTPAPYVDPNALDRKLAKGKPVEPKTTEPELVLKVLAPTSTERSKETKTARTEGSAGSDSLPKKDTSLLEASRAFDSKPITP